VSKWKTWAASAAYWHEGASMNEQLGTVLLTKAEWANFYAQLGFRVMPLKPHGKTPIIKNWTQDATTDLDVISGWWANLPESNIGILTGHVSGIVDIETDKHEGAADGESELLSWCKSNSFEIPKTWAYKSGGGGIHRLYDLHAALGSKNGILPGVDVKADKGQSVFSPSIHPNGNRYEWLPGCSPADMPQGPVQLPLELYNLIVGEQKTHVPLTLPDIVPEGQRDTLMFKFACKLRQTGLTGTELLAVMEVINEERCEPPLTEAEIKKKCEQAERYPIG
jgi:hypothetical protein